jgi:hypothetical protein
MFEHTSDGFSASGMWKNSIPAQMASSHNDGKQWRLLSLEWGGTAGDDGFVVTKHKGLTKWDAQ